MAEGFAKVVKCLLFVANIMILICGIAALAVGVWTLANRSFMERLLGSDLYVSSAHILIATGGIVIVISFLGCYGAIKEIKYMLLAFFIILSIMFIVMLVGGVLGYVCRSDVEKQMHQEMVMSIPQYKNETAVTFAWDAVQDNFKCCGLTIDNDDSYLIWRKNGAFQNDKMVPESCCKSKNESIEQCQLDPKNYAYTKDCYVEMKDFVKKHALILGGISIGVSCFLIVGMILSCALFMTIK